MAQFTGSYSAAQTVTVNQAITVGEIDFGTTKNITITSSGSNVLTLDNTGTSGNAVLDVGLTNSNSGIDLISAPISVAAATPLNATISGGTLQLTNTSTGATANVIGSTSSFTVNSGGTLRESALGTGSLVTGNLTDTGALNNATLNLAGGTFIIDPTASTAANGLASKYIVQSNNQLTSNDFADHGGHQRHADLPDRRGRGRSRPGRHLRFRQQQPCQQPIPSAPSVPTTNFGARWTGMIEVATPGPTTFTSTTTTP